MTSSRLRMLIALASGVLSVCALLAYTSMVRAQAFQARDQALQRYGGEVVKLCVTTQPVSAGEKFNEENTAVVSWLIDLVPEGALQDQKELLGKHAAISRPANTPLLPQDVSELAYLQVPEGKIACSIPSNDVRSVGGALLPGQYVDAYVLRDGAQLLAQNLYILATNVAPQGVLREEKAHLKWITFALDPELVESFLSAASFQQLYLVLPSSPHNRDNNSNKPLQKTYQTPENSSTYRDEGSSTPQPKAVALPASEQQDSDGALFKSTQADSDGVPARSMQQDHAEETGE